jgi:hypothetical protein
MCSTKEWGRIGNEMITIKFAKNRKKDSQGKYENFG